MVVAVGGENIGTMTLIGIAVSSDDVNKMEEDLS